MKVNKDVSEGSRVCACSAVSVYRAVIDDDTGTVAGVGRGDRDGSARDSGSASFCAAATRADMIVLAASSGTEIKGNNIPNPASTVAAGKLTPPTMRQKAYVCSGFILRTQEASSLASRGQGSLSPSTSPSLCILLAVVIFAWNLAVVVLRVEQAY